MDYCEEAKESRSQGSKLPTNELLAGVVHHGCGTRQPGMALGPEPGQLPALCALPTLLRCHPPAPNMPLQNPGHRAATKQHQEGARPGAEEPETLQGLCILCAHL